MSVDSATQPTRERVVSSIMSHGPSTARELGDRLGLTPAAIRRHLSGLMADGTIACREERVYGSRGRGRPSKIFLLTDQGHATFRQAYDELAISAIRQLIAVAGPQAARSIAQERFAQVEQRYLQAREQNPEFSPAQALAAALEEDGYAPALVPVHSGVQLCQRHCPVAHVAAEFPMLCEVETQLFSQLLDSHVQRLATIAHGDGVCTTHVPNPLPTEETNE